jgi:hypothetical protein
VLPEKFASLSNDLLAYWDEHYPSSKFPPPENYKNTKIDIESNRVVPRHDFMRDMHYVQELVNIFEHLFEGLEVQLVWFIKKRRRGDGFQRWHQDLVANATTAATIVVNIDSILAEDELARIEEIRESHRLMEEVLVNTASNNENESEPGDQECDTIGKVGVECEARKAPHKKLQDDVSSTMGHVCNKFGDDSDFHWDNRHDTIREIGLECKDQKKDPKILTTRCSDGRCDDDQVGLSDARHDTFGTVGVECEVLKTPPERIMTGRTYVRRDDVSDTFEHVGNKVGNTFRKAVLEVDNRKRPPEEILTSVTTDQVIMPFVPSLPPMMILPNTDQQHTLQGI